MASALSMEEYLPQLKNMFSQSLTLRGLGNQNLQKEIFAAIAETLQEFIKNKNYKEKNMVAAPMLFAPRGKYAIEKPKIEE